MALCGAGTRTWKLELLEREYYTSAITSMAYVGTYRGLMIERIIFAGFACSGARTQRELISGFLYRESELRTNC